jgi:hypothetical protein
MFFRVIVAGSRTFRNYDLLRSKLDILLRNKVPDVLIVSGGAPGADALGERYAREREFPIDPHPANWPMLGKRAGFVRNLTMANCADALVAFWDGESPGTRSMIDIALRQGLEVRVVRLSSVD